jgi:hypothetical protein
MASFRGLYDKLVSFIFDTSKDDAYSPVSSDYVAVYDSDGPRNSDNNATWMPKKYVPVTTIGTGGGGGGGSMSSFNAQGSGVIQVSLDGSTYISGPVIVENGNTLYVQANSIPSGLTWQGGYDSGIAYDVNDVVSTNYSSVYATWWAQEAVPVGEAPPVGSTSNYYWVQLGTQGPIGPEGPPNAIATSAFRPSPTSTTVLASGSNVGINNDRGVFILMENTGSATLTIPSGLSTDPTTGIPLNSQVSVMRINTGTVQVIAASGVTLRSADNATYLRTQYSSATLIRKAANEWYLFGDLTNIA